MNAMNPSFRDCSLLGFVFDLSQPTGLHTNMLLKTFFNLGFYPAGFSAGTPYASLVKELDFPQRLLRLGVSSKDKQKHYTARCLVITVNCLEEVALPRRLKAVVPARKFLWPPIL
jgi:hypothetical protein